MAMTKLLGRMGYGDFTIHGMRATFKTWASEATTHDNHLIELSLAHSIGNAVEAAYRRTDLLDRRRQLMVDWADFCAGTPRRGKVVTLRRGRT